jgi:very-short-patch-repair endonuclease
MAKIDRTARTWQLRSWIEARDGVVHTTEVRAAGFSTHDIALAESAGTILRVRRSWLATTACEPIRLRAASMSGRITCVSAAQRRHLWIPRLDETMMRPHIAVRPTSSRFDAEGVNVHWASGPMAVSRGAIEDPMVNVLFHIARCLDQVDALAVWESALRKQLVDPAVLSRVRWGSSRARELAALASVLSDSGLETVFVAGIRRLALPIRQQVWLAGHPVDALIGDRLVVQLDGFEHHQAADRRRDLRHDAELVLLGYTVLRFDFQQIFFDWAYVETAVLTAVAQGLHLAPSTRSGSSAESGRSALLQS